MIVFNPSIEALTMSESLQKGIETAVEILRGAGAKEVYLFGSAARGAEGLDSDIDLAVRGLPAHVFFDVVGRIEMALAHDFDLVDLDDRNPFTEYLERKGKLVRVA